MVENRGGMGMHRMAHGLQEEEEDFLQFFATGLGERRPFWLLVVAAVAAPETGAPVADLRRQTADDPRNGKGGTQEEGGEGGHFPLNENWSWDGNENNIIGKDGEQWQGGDGSIFGAGGGGGFFGGGGGGSTPGIVGGGGGGSSFANDDVKHVVTLLGKGKTRRNE